MKLIRWIVSLFKAKTDERIERALQLVKELESRKPDTVKVYHEVTRFNDNDIGHIREIATIAANEHFRSFLYFEREKIVEQIERLEPDQKDILNGLYGALKGLSILTRSLETTIMAYAEVSRK